MIIPGKMPVKHPPITPVLRPNLPFRTTGESTPDPDNDDSAADSLVEAFKDDIESEPLQFTND